MRGVFLGGVVVTVLAVIFSVGKYIAAESEVRLTSKQSEEAFFAVASDEHVILGASRQIEGGVLPEGVEAGRSRAGSAGRAGSSGPSTGISDGGTVKDIDENVAPASGDTQGRMEAERSRSTVVGLSGDSRPPPGISEEAWSQLPLMRALDAEWAVEPVDSAWGPATESSVIQVLVTSEFSFSHVQGECRSTICRFQLGAGSIIAPDERSGYLEGVTQVLEPLTRVDDIRLNQIDGAYVEEMNMSIVYLFHRPEHASPSEVPDELLRKLTEWEAQSEE